MSIAGFLGVQKYRYVEDIQILDNKKQGYLHPALEFDER
jgi:hypothetical protein